MHDGGANAGDDNVDDVMLMIHDADDDNLIGVGRWLLSHGGQCSGFKKEILRGIISTPLVGFCVSCGDELLRFVNQIVKLLMEYPIVRIVLSLNFHVRIQWLQLLHVLSKLVEVFPIRLAAGAYIATAKELSTHDLRSMANLWGTRQGHDKHTIYARYPQDMATPLSTHQRRRASLLLTRHKT